jgi:hypothetical protein
MQANEAMLQSGHRLVSNLFLIVYNVYYMKQFT